MTTLDWLAVAGIAIIAIAWIVLAWIDASDQVAPLPQRRMRF